MDGIHQHRILKMIGDDVANLTIRDYAVTKRRKCSLVAYLVRIQAAQSLAPAFKK